MTTHNLFDKDAFQPETRNKKMSYKEFKFEKDAFTSKPKVFEEKPNANRPPVKEEPLTELSRSEVHARSAKFVEPAPKKKTKNFTVSLRRPKGK